MRNDGEKYRYKCGSCINLNLNKPINDGFSCLRKYGVCKIMDDSCSRGWPYEFDENRDYDEVERLEKSCYLTTLICDILGFDDNCEILITMRSFRNNVLQKDLRYLNILMEYDTIGPKISECLRNDENALWIAKELLENFIKPIIILINNGNYDAAAIMYQQMTNILKENYSLDDSVIDISGYDQSKGGHGRVYTKVNC